MTAPGGGAGGSGNVGTAYGKVRIDYESSNVSKAVKDVEALQQALVSTGQAGASSAKGVDRAVGSIGQLQTAAKRLSQVNAPNPAAGVGKAVENETQRAAKALQQLQGASVKNIKLKTAINVTPSEVTIDRGAIARATRAIRLDPIAVRTQVRVDASEVVVDGAAINRAIQGHRFDTVTVRIPFRIDPASVQVNQGSINSAAQRAAQSASAAASGAGGAASGGGTAGAAGLVGMLGKITLAGGAAAAAVGGVGYVIAKGFSRLNSIDEATNKLKILGLTAGQIQNVSNSALESVKGTAFGLDEAFSTAATAINAGVKPGEQLNKYLNATANTAALAGVGMEELGSSFSRAATQGKLTGEIAQTLYDRQVPLLKLLADEYNVTQQKAQDMVSNGEVDFAHFVNAMSKTGGAAKAMGNTIGGSFNNLKASVSRLGASLLAPFFGKKDASDATIIASAIQKVTGVLDSLGNAAKNNYPAIVTFWEGLGKTGLVVAKVFTTVISFITDAVVKATEVFGDLVGWAATAVGKVAGFFGADGVAQDAKNFADQMHNLGAGLRENRDINMGKLNRTLDTSWGALEKWKQGAIDARNAGQGAGDAAEQAAPKFISVADALDGLQIKSDAATTALEGTVEQFKDFLKQVKDKGGSDALIAQLKVMRDQFDNGGRQIKSYADAIDKMHDSTASAADKATDLIKALQGLGVLPGGDALSSYNEEFDKMTSATSTLINNLDTTGNALANMDGTLNLNTGNGRAVLKQIEDIRQQMVALVSSGEASPEEAYQRTVQGLNQLLQGQAGISADVAQKIIDTYLPKDAILKSITAADPKSAIEQLFQNDPAKLQSELNLLTTAQDIINKIVGPDGQLHVPTVLDTAPPTGGPSYPSNFVGPLPPGATREPTAAPPAAPAPAPGPPPSVGPQAPIAPPPVTNGPPVPAPPNTLQPTDLGGLLGAPGGAYTLDPTQQKQLTQIANTPDALAKALKDNPAIASSLQGLVDQANAQGQNMGVALAQGMLSSSDEVKRSLVELATLAGDYLGHSPAKYGPLSGKGWTLYRGKVFTSDWAKGIASESGQVEGAVSDTAAGASKAVGSLSNSGGLGGNGVTLNDGLTQLISDMQQFSDFGKSLLDFGKQIGDIAFQGLKFANDLSGGALFPKSYKPDPNAKAPGSVLGGWNPTQNRAMMPGLNGQPGTGGFQGSGQTSTPPGALGANPTKQQIADYITNKALSLGYSRQQANDFVIQAAGESGFDPGANGGNQDGSGAVRGIFQFTPGTWGNRPGSMTDATNNIDEYFNLAKERGLTPQTFTQGSQLGTQVSIGGPWHPQNQAQGHLANAEATAAPYIAGYQPGSAMPAAPTTVPPSAKILSEKYGAFEPGGAVPAVAAARAKNGTVDGFAVTPDGKGGFTFATAPQAQTNQQNGVTATPGGLLAGLDLSGKGVNLAGAHGQVALVAAIAKQFGLEMTSGASNHSQDKGFHPTGQAGDFSNGQGNTPEQAAFAKFMASNFGPLLQELIYSDPNAPGVLRGGGKDVTGGSYYSADTLGDHLNHVHIAVKDELATAFTEAVSQASGIDASALVQGVSQGQPGVPVTLTGQSSQALQALVGNTTMLPTMPAQLRDLITQDPELANALSNTGALTQETVVPVLQKLDTLQAQQNKLAGPNTKSPLADAIGGVKSQLQSSFGMTEGPSALDQAQTIFSGATGIASDVFAAVDAGIKWIGGVQDFTNVMVRGIANTGDVNKLIDDVQTGIDLAAKVFQAAGSITSFAGSFSGGADMGGTSAAGQALSMIGTVISAVNTGIDIAQEAWKIATKYLGRTIQGILGLSGASDVRYLLDEKTGQVHAYSSDNPQQKTTMNTLGRELGSSRYSERPAVQNNMTVYQGPGQDPRDTMDDAMFTIRSSGLGAFGNAV